MAHIIEQFARSIFLRGGKYPASEWNAADYATRQPYLLLASSHLKYLAAINNDDAIVNTMRDFRADAQV